MVDFLTKVRLKITSMITREDAYIDYMTYDELKEGIDISKEDFENVLKHLIKEDLVFRVFDKKKNEMGYVLNIERVDEIEEYLGIGKGK